MNIRKVQREMDQGARIAQEAIDHCNQILKDQPELAEELQIIIDAAVGVIERRNEFYAILRNEDDSDNS
jgi:hypothetical protein